MKIFNVILKVLFSLILLLPIVGSFGVLGEPTRELYNTDLAYDFIRMLTETKYITIINAIIFAISLVLIWTRHMALAALLVLPITVNVVAFHAFIDGGLLTGGALLGNIMLLLNVYFLWHCRDHYSGIWEKSAM